MASPVRTRRSASVQKLVAPSMSLLEERGPSRSSVVASPFEEGRRFSPEASLLTSSLGVVGLGRYIQQHCRPISVAMNRLTRCHPNIADCSAPLLIPASSSSVDVRRCRQPVALQVGSSSDDCCPSYTSTVRRQRFGQRPRRRCPVVVHPTPELRRLNPSRSSPERLRSGLTQTDTTPKRVEPSPKLPVR